MTAQPPSRPAATPAGSGRPGDDDGAWHRRVWQLAGPIILANLTTPLLGAVDTAVVGHLPDPSFIGGVAGGGVIFSFLFWGRLEGRRGGKEGCSTCSIRGGP